MALSIAVCRRCFLQWPYDALIREAVTALWVCSDCLDNPDPRQVFFVPKIDNPSLSHASPDQAIPPNVTYLSPEPALTEVMSPDGDDGMVS